MEGLAERVAELEELLHGKEAIVGALNAEIDHLRAETASPNSSQSQGSSTHGRDIISLYHIKVCCISLLLDMIFLQCSIVEQTFRKSLLYNLYDMPFLM